MSLILVQVNKTKVTFIVMGGASPLDTAASSVKLYIYRLYQPRPGLTEVCVCVRAAEQVSSSNVPSVVERFYCLD